MLESSTGTYTSSYTPVVRLSPTRGTSGGDTAGEVMVSGEVTLWDRHLRRTLGTCVGPAIGTCVGPVIGTCVGPVIGTWDRTWDRTWRWRRRWHLWKKRGDGRYDRLVHE